MDKLLFTAFLSGGLSLLCIYAIRKIVNIRRFQIYGRISPSVFFEHYIDRIYKLMAKSKAFIKINEEIACKISVFNALSFEKNNRFATLMFLIFLFVMLTLSVVLTCVFLPFWYIAFVYIVIISAVLLFIIQLLSDMVMNRYLKYMPETLKILQSRFISKGSISKAIHVSIPDFHKGIRSEMIRIYDALKLNETEKTKEIFQKINKKYSNEHMTVLLDLIWLAHYSGGLETIKAQFDIMVKDIIDDIENRRDLRGTAVSYMGMSFLFMAALPAVKLYNGSILDSPSMSFYDSREGMLLSVAYIGFLVLLIAILTFIEKRG